MLLSVVEFKDMMNVATEAFFLVICFLFLVYAAFFKFFILVKFGGCVVQPLLINI